jgi:pilus assembly protein Flp/PilA
MIAFVKLQALAVWVTARVFGRDPEEGATLVEYGLLVALIAVVAMAVVFALGVEVQKMFQSVVDQLRNPSTGGS